jgi:hypothetical protein
VLVVLSAVMFGGFVVSSALSRPVGPSVSVGGLVRVSPLSGWEFADRITSPPGARLTRGSGNLDFFAVSFPGSARDLAREAVNRILEPNAERLSVSQTFVPVRFASGLEGVRISYVGLFGKGQSAIEGQVTAVVSPSGRGAVFDGWAPQGLLQYSLGDIDTMIDTAGIR